MAIITLHFQCAVGVYVKHFQFGFHSPKKIVLLASIRRIYVGILILYNFFYHKERHSLLSTTLGGWHIKYFIYFFIKYIFLTQVPMSNMCHCISKQWHMLVTSNEEAML